MIFCSWYLLCLIYKKNTLTCYIISFRKKAPGLKGLGYAMFVTCCLTTVYYAVLQAWSFIYLFKVSYTYRMILNLLRNHKIWILNFNDFNSQNICKICTSQSLQRKYVMTKLDNRQNKFYKIKFQLEEQNSYLKFKICASVFF